MTSAPTSSLERLAAALVERHLASLTRPELLRAARALSARYVEGRGSLPSRSPLDSAGKRAAFAVLFAPIHFATVEAIVTGLAAPVGALSRIVDLGCGTGAASAAWALSVSPPARPTLLGVDTHRWALAEAAWTWRTLGLPGRVRRADMVAEASRLGARRGASLAGMGIVAAWSVNELTPAGRSALLGHLREAARRQATVLVIEPLSRRAAPWFPEWTRAVEDLGGRADEWHLANRLPASLQALDRDAGFDRTELGARSLMFGG
ncbi:MAG TPA: class I SAM-dependent methyltransferase [Vicinamibacterales bacterium]|nr:class I SAM-dependent methyltransferase [Vicinamibacterales bacterium]